MRSPPFAKCISEVRAMIKKSLNSDGHQFHYQQQD